MKRNPFIAVRVTPEIVEKLDKLSLEHGLSRTKLIHDLLNNADSFYRFIESEKLKQQAETEKLIEELVPKMMGIVVQDVASDTWRIIAEVAHRVAENKVIEEQKGVDNGKK